MIHLRTLGESVIQVGDRQVNPSAPRVFAAVLYLALESGRQIPRAQLQELLFPKADDRNGAHSLRQLLYRVRRLGVAVEADGATVCLPKLEVSVDYERVLRSGLASRADLETIARGVLPGFSGSFSPPFAEWLEQRRAAVLGQLRRMLTGRLVEERAAARWVSVEETARALLALDAFNEEATLGLAEAVALRGSKVEAVTLLDQYLDEVGPRDRALRVPATILRRRIAERLPRTSVPPATFVGRAGPLASLRQLLDCATAGETKACHVWGEAGIGKTRLVTELCRVAVLDGALVQEVRSQPHDARRPMGAFTDLVPALLKLPGALGCSPQAITYLTKLFKYDDEPGARLSPDVRDSELLSANITRAISELLDAVATESPIVLVVEDAQWLDAISLRVLADLVAERKRRSLLLLLTSRGPTLEIGGRSFGSTSSLRLEPLAAADSRQLLREVFDANGTEATQDVIEWCLALAAGNPFFLHSLAAHYALTRSRNAIPEPLSALLRQRLSVLDRRARMILEAAAVLGRHSSYDNVSEVLALPNHELLRGLRSLEELGFIRPEGEGIVPAHALFSELVLEDAPRSVKTVLHRSAGRVLGRLAANRGSPGVLWDCAEQWLRAGDPNESISVLRACGRHALEIGRPADAVDALRKALEFAEHTTVRVALLRDLLAAAEIAGAWAIVLEALAELKRFSSGDDLLLQKRRRDRLLELEARMSSSSDPRGLGPSLRECAYDEGLSPADRFRACFLLTVLAEDLLAPDVAADAYRAARGVAVSPEACAGRDVFLMIYHASFGDLDQSIEVARRVVASSETEQNVAAPCRRRLVAALALFRGGSVEEACNVLEACYNLSASLRLYNVQYRAAAHLASVYRDLGQLDEGLGWHKRSVAALDRLNGPTKLADYYSNCVLFAIAAGELNAARDWLNQAVRAAPYLLLGGVGLHFRALNLRVRQLADDYDCPDSELAGMYADHVRHRAYGHHDEVMEAVWHALVRKGREAEANTLFVEYRTQHRRFRCPLSPGLVEIQGRASGAGASMSPAGWSVDPVSIATN